MNCNMYSCKLISIVLFLIISVKSADIETIETNERHNGKPIDIKETDNLIIKMHLDNSSTVTNCKGSCTVNRTKVDISCVGFDEPRDYINVTVKGKVTENHSGKWSCSYLITVLALDETKNASYQTSNDFELHVKSYSFWHSGSLWFWIAIGTLVVIVLLIIIIQTWCIVHFKRKAKAVRREAQWSSRKNDKTEDKQTVRYSKMPGLKKKEILIPESRESAIYEVLENIRGAPEPPPVESLPGKKAEPISPVPPELPASTSWTFNSLLRKKNKKPEEPITNTKTSTIDKRTTMERVKERPPLPTPIEEDVYEAIETPPPLRKAMKKHAAKEKLVPKEDFKAFAQPPKPKGAVPLQTSAGSVAPPLNAILKQAVEKRNHLSPVQPQPPPPKPKTLATPKEPPRQAATLQPIPKRKPWQNDSTLPKTKQRPKEPVAPKETTWQEEAATIPRAKVWPKEPTVPKEKVWPKEPTAPKERAWPREPIAPQEGTLSREALKTKVWRRPAPSEPEQWQEEAQRPTGSLRPNVKPFNPGLPPPEAPPAIVRTPWGEAIPSKPRPAPPVKPKQLHPLPPPPVEPEPIRVETETEDGDSDDSEFSVYDELPQYNIYNM